MGSRQVNTSWTPPPDNALNFRNNCGLAAQWWAAALSAQQDLYTVMAPVKVNYDVPVDLILNYLHSLVPDGYNPAPSDSDILVWYRKGLSPTAQHNLSSFPQTRCDREVCKHLEWLGDPDISGVGMVISYYMVALFTTIYFAVITFSQLRGLWMKKWNRSYDPGTLVKGFTESVNTFLDAALLFAISMLIAAVTRYSTVIHSPGKYYSVYQLIASAYMATFTIFPAVALQFIASDLRRQWIRLFLWMIAIAFAIALDVVYRRAYKTRNWNSQEERDQEALELVWLHKCDSVSLRFLLEDTITTGHVYLGINVCGWFYYVIASFISKRWKPKPGNKHRLLRWWSTSKPYLRLFNSFASLLLMWLFLQLFVRYRNFVASTAGHAYEDNTWTFGQVLALATWVPVLMDLGSIYIFGPEDGLSSKLSKKYRVLAVPFRVPQHSEKETHSHTEQRSAQVDPSRPSGVGSHDQHSGRHGDSGMV